MKTETQIKKGQEVAIRDSKGNAAHVAVIDSVTKDGYAVAISGFKNTKFFEKNGRAFGRWMAGFTLDFDVEKARAEIIAKQAKIQEAVAKARALESTPEYILASEFVDSCEPEKSIAAFSKLGISKLQQIKAWLDESKTH